MLIHISLPESAGESDFPSLEKWEVGLGSPCRRVDKFVEFSSHQQLLDLFRRTYWRSHLGAVRESDFATLERKVTSGLGRLGVIGMVKNANALEIGRLFVQTSILNHSYIQQPNGHYYQLDVQLLDYVRECAAAAGKKKKAISQRIAISIPPNPMVGLNSAPYNTLIDPEASNLCENCYTRPKSQETDGEGTVITLPYCGVRCSLTSQRSILPLSNIPVPAAAPMSRNLSNLLMERVNTPIWRSILLMMQDRWKSDELGTPQLKDMYRIDLPGQVYRRFDLALQMNDGCPVTATYYSGIATCSIANYKDPAPCGSESCQVCDVLCSSFSNVPHGASSRDGAYGPGLYTYQNPALAHHVAISGDNQQSQDKNYALIQCRVVTQENYGLGSKSFIGSTDASGVTFCAQSTAIIPTHLLIYTLDALPDTQQLAGSVKTIVASIGPAASAATPTSGGVSQPKSSTNTGEIKLKTTKGKGKAHAKVPFHQQIGQGGTGSAANQTAPMPVPPPPPLIPATRPGKFSSYVAQEKAKVAAKKQAVRPSALNAPHSGGSNAPVSVQSSAPAGIVTCELHVIVFEAFTKTSRGNCYGARHKPAANPDDVIGRLPPLQDYFDKGATGYPNQTNSGGNKKATRQSSSPVTGHAGDPSECDYDQDLRTSAVVARKFMGHLSSRMDEDDDFDYLNPDELLGRRQEQDKYDEDEDADLPEHPPGHDKRRALQSALENSQNLLRSPLGRDKRAGCLAKLEPRRGFAATNSLGILKGNSMLAPKVGTSLSKPEGEQVGAFVQLMSGLMKGDDSVRSAVGMSAKVEGSTKIQATVTNSEQASILRQSYIQQSNCFLPVCENCGVRPKHNGHKYCGKMCAASAGRKKKATPQNLPVSGPPNPVVASNSVPYNPLIESDTSDLCDVGICSVRDGASSLKTYDLGSVVPASNIPAPAAAPISRNFSNLLMEHVSTPIGRSIAPNYALTGGWKSFLSVVLLMMQNRWKSDRLRTPQLKGIYRIGLSEQVFRRFDLALQMNDGCPVTATYYGGIASCSIVNDKDPALCGSESCQVCDVLSSSFGNMPYGASSRDGAYGSGLYTYKNPALAHHVAISDVQQPQDTNYALIQCRVVTQENYGLSLKSFAGFIDNSGVVFCAQSAAVIPTHLLIYSLGAPPKTPTPLPPCPPLVAAFKPRSAVLNSVLAGFAVRPSPPDAPSPGDSNAPQAVRALKAAPEGDTFGNAEGYAGQMYRDNRVWFSGWIHAARLVMLTYGLPIYRTNSAYPGPGSVYIQTAAGFVPIRGPAPPGIKASTPVPNLAAASRRDVMVSKPGETLPASHWSLPQDDFNTEGKSYPGRSGRPFSMGFECHRAIILPFDEYVLLSSFVRYPMGNNVWRITQATLLALILAKICDPMVNYTYPPRPECY
ncbi:hypothetical protein M407DRAFT_5090 [Tulasnella calospora MUT 4182]|uniref:Uncharacterized protein n=1 Tax=Tulasnella calospora MUT 4182 TaxID=1051891 RepID=A0A0C3MCK3_9AGAM|nr:hypothetical protein M407DRAFT_5090 [Tulasnella calospora MUT 4182]